MPLRSGVLPLMINGQLVERPGFKVLNPATGEVCGECPAATKEDVEAAVKGAHQAFQSWRRTSVEERVAKVQEMRAALEPLVEELAEAIAAENGKPVVSATAEVRSTLLSTFDGFCAMAPEALQPYAVHGHAAADVLCHCTPIGVVAAICPWNFPVHTTFQKIVPALLAGNTVVVKPSPFTPLADIISVNAAAAVLPPGVLSVVCGEDRPGASVGQWLTEATEVRVVSFTGSTPTGRRVMAAAAASLKHVHLELGGNDAAIILPSFPVGSDTGRALAKALVWAAFKNSGQVCHGLKRVYAHDSIFDKLVDLLTQEVQALKVGSSHEEGVQVGPLTTGPQLELVSSLVQSAVENGAKVVLGGKRLERPGNFYEPTLLLCEGNEDVVLKEQFGPVMPIVRYSEIDSAVAAANGTEFGLSGSVWGDVDEARQVVEQLECGTQWVNQHSSGPTCGHINYPFGGVKQSGMGREKGPEGLRAYTQIVTRNVSLL